MLTFFTTGYYREAPRRPWRRGAPNAYGKWLLVQANAARLADPADRRGLAAIAGRKLADPAADIADLRPTLDAEGRAVMALLDNTDPERVPALVEALPASIRADLRALDLARRDLSKLRFELILVHGRDDPIIPASESRALAAAAPAGQASLHIVDSLGHVELGPGGLLDGIGLWRAVYRLLAERDAAPAPLASRCLPAAGTG